MPERIYKTGDRFLSKHGSRYEEYILAQVDSSMVTLIGLECGNRLTGAIRVQHPNCITQEEIDCLLGHIDYVTFIDPDFANEKDR